MFDFYFYPVLKFISAKGQKRTKDKKGQRTKKGQNKSAPNASNLSTAVKQAFNDSTLKAKSKDIGSIIQSESFSSVDKYCNLIEDYVHDNTM
jgi:hypothetical protein